jgi:hypothetical protein
MSASTKVTLGGVSIVTILTKTLEDLVTDTKSALELLSSSNGTPSLTIYSSDAEVRQFIVRALQDRRAIDRNEVDRRKNYE